MKCKVIIRFRSEFGLSWSTKVPLDTKMSGTEGTRTSVYRTKVMNLCCHGAEVSPLFWD